MKKLVAFCLVFFLPAVLNTAGAQGMSAHAAGALNDPTATAAADIENNNITTDSYNGSKDGNENASTATAYPVAYVWCLANMYVGDKVAVKDNSIDGAWSSADSKIATVDGNGVVTAVSAGMVNIRHNTGGNYITVTPVIVYEPKAPMTITPGDDKGIYKLNGNTGSNEDENVKINVTDAENEVIFSKEIIAHGGLINEKITLGNVDGINLYRVIVKTTKGNRVLHFAEAE